MKENSHFAISFRGYLKYSGIGIFLLSFALDIGYGYGYGFLSLFLEILGLCMFVFTAFPPSLPMTLMKRLPPWTGYTLRTGGVLFFYSLVMIVFLENSVIKTTTEDTVILGSLLLIGILGVLLLVITLLSPALYNFLRCRTASDDRVLFANMLADLLEMGIPLNTAVSMMAEELHGRMTSRYTEVAFAVDVMVAELSRGSNLSRAFLLSKAFPEHWSLHVAEAEIRGDIIKSLRLLAQMEPQSPELSPGISIQLMSVFALLIFVIPFFTTYIMPTFVSLMEGMSLSLPLINRVVIGIFKASTFLKIAPLLVVFILLCVFIPLLRQWVGWLLYSISLKIPFLWKLEKLNQQAVAASSLAAAISIDMPLPSALRFTASATRSSPYRQAFLTFAGDSGRTLTDYLSSQPDLFSAPFRWLVAQGETFGSLKEALTTAVQYFEEAYGLERNRALIIMEICAVLFVGSLVALFALNIFMPLYMILGTIAGEVTF